jgi:hypothetical protein
MLRFAVDALTSFSHVRSSSPRGSASSSAFSFLYILVVLLAEAPGINVMG